MSRASKATLKDGISHCTVVNIYKMKYIYIHAQRKITVLNIVIYNPVGKVGGSFINYCFLLQ